MKFNIKALLVGAALILGMQGNALQAISPATIAQIKEQFKTFEFFNQLPKEVQSQIIGLLDAGSFEASMKQLSQLRVVNKQMKDLIENEYTGKQIINAIAQRYQETPDYRLIHIVFKQNLPSSYAWIKEQAKLNPNIRQTLTYNILSILTGHSRMVGDPVTYRPLNENELKEIKQLLLVGADPKFEMTSEHDKNRWTLLTLAAAIGDLEAVQLFLEEGANINHIVSEEKGTALDQAIEHKDKAPKGKELIELLKSKGAKTSAELGKK